MSKNDYIYFENRIKKLRKILDKKNIPALILIKDEDIFYFTGFYGKDSSSILFINQDEIYLFVNSIFLEQAKKEILRSFIQVVEYKKEKFKKLAESIGNLRKKIIAVEGEKIIYSEFILLQEILMKQKIELKNINDLTFSIRQIKDELEIEILKKASMIIDLAFSSQLNRKTGYFLNVSETENALEIEKIMIKNGASGKSFNFVIASNDKSSMPHYQSSNKKIKNGLLLMDFGCRYINYLSDITRTIFLGNSNILNDFRKIYDIVLQAQLLAIENCREGITAGELDKIARDYIIKKGYGENFMHSLGHGVGLEIHEYPYLRTGSNEVLKENMVVTIEPGIYIPGKGGVRIEDMVLVRKNCCEIFYRSKKELTVI